MRRLGNRGATAIEYGLLAGLIGGTIVAIGGWTGWSVATFALEQNMLAIGRVIFSGVPGS